ncbi:MAG TPA: histidinol-phosphatase HisJ family protein, partial [Thermoanaerobaculia bacterium]|nr:histidinol-phosphatase HisJ family protein [Thermoanaerobaculia bacterium]
MSPPPPPVPVAPWRVSLHGGHSGQFCGHAAGTLEEVLEAAVAAGFRVYGVSEHAPRSDERFLYQEERDHGFDVARLVRDFEEYAAESRRLVPLFAGRLTVLRGFEAEVVPEATWAAEMAEHRRRHGLDYVVGSVHHVDGHVIDGRPDELAAAIASRGGLEAVAVAYYRALAAMVETLRPEVVGHFDLVRKLAAPFGAVDTPAARRAALDALDAVAAAGSVLDVNTAGLRTGVGHPYPAPWIVREAA